MSPRNRTCQHCHALIHYSQRWAQWFNTVGPVAPCSSDTGHSPSPVITSLNVGI
jgi:hypothetical protein